MKRKNTQRGWPAGEPTMDWNLEQFVAYLRNQYKHLTAPDGKIRKAVGATDADIKDIAAEIAMLEQEIAKEKAKLN